MHLGGGDSDSDFEEQFKEEYIRSEGALPGSSRDKKIKRMGISEIIVNEKSSSDSESSGSASDNYDDKSTTDTRIYSNETHKRVTNVISTSIPHVTASKRLSMLKDCEKVLKNSSALKRHAIMKGTQKLKVPASSLQLASDELNLSESSSDDEAHCYITKTKRVKKINKEYNVITTETKNIDQDVKSINLHHTSQIPQQDSEMAIQLESLAMSYNSVSKRAESSREAGQNDITKLRDIADQNSDINKLLSLGEGVSIEDTKEICENKGSILGMNQESKSIEITLEDTDSIPGRLKKKKVDPHTLLMNEINRIQRALRVVLHKCSFLCLASHLRYINSYLGAPGIINENHKQLLLAVGLSIVPAAHVTLPEKLNMVRLSTFVSWFRDAFPVVNESSMSHSRGSECSDVGPLFEKSPKVILQRSLSNFVCERKEHLVFIFVLAARALGWNTRLTMNLDTISLKVNKKSDQSNDEIGQPDPQSDSNMKLPMSMKNQGQKSPNTNKNRKNAKSNDYHKNYTANTHDLPQLDGLNDFTESSSSDKEKKSIKNKNRSPKKSAKLEKSNNEPDENYKNKCRSVAATIKEIRQRRKMEHTKKEKKVLNQNEHFESKNKKYDGIEKDKKLSTKALSEAASRRVSKSVASNTYSKQLSSDSDSDESNNYYSEKDQSCESKLSPKKRPVKNVQNKSPNKSTSSHKNVEASYTRNKPCQYWAEVYIDPKWVTVDVINGRVDCPAAIENNLLGRMSKGKNKMIMNTSEKILYVIAANTDGSLKDVTKRYTSDKYMTITRKLRAPVEEWIGLTLKPFEAIERTKQGKIETVENRYLEKALANAPMPKTLGAFKNHPFYVLKKDLNKNQAIYPNDAPTLGFIQGQGIYARECVHELQSRTGWLKQGLVVKLGEEPYKIVTSKSKLDKMSGEKNCNQPLETFGKWQTEKYIPPAAKDGKVPRNEYGNVELFKPWMLPKGTIHIPIQGLSRLAKKLNIDCAPAMVGWEFLNGAMRPVYDGYVICEEANDYIMDAWNQEMDEQMKKEASKREKRAIANWTKLTRGMLLYKKIASKYSKK